MSINESLLVELGCEELPAGSLLSMAQYLGSQLTVALKAEAFEPGDMEIFATPRRIAVLIQSVKQIQDDRELDRRGPSVQAAFDEDGNAKPAAIGFAKSCGIEVNDLQRIKTDKGEWLFYKLMQPGATLEHKLESMLEKIFNTMPMPKRMRWSDKDIEFIRPVHWLLAMHGNEPISGSVLGLEFGIRTRGHRFHSPDWINMLCSDLYNETLLKEGKIIANFAERRIEIVKQVNANAKKYGAMAVMDDDLIDEVTALVEWPIAVTGTFEEEYLDVPKEALIQTMQDNQRYFPLLAEDGSLKAGFITIANIESSNLESIRSGNERVVRPRLADARFFWQQDQKKPLHSHLDSLKKVIFQRQLGTLFDKTQRLIYLSEKIAMLLDVDVRKCKRAAELSKCDLMTEMVYEFAKMQGVAGRYYAEIGGEDIDICNAIEEQYLPKQAGDKTPATAVGQVLAIADKLDTLGGIIGIGQIPTGTKDPFALRRTSLGLLRIIIENDLDLDLGELLELSKKSLASKLEEPDKVDDALAYALDRLVAYYQDKDVQTDVIDAVMCKGITRPLDFEKRIRAISKFRTMPEAQALASANKRIRNILKKSDAINSNMIDESLFAEDAEKVLSTELRKLSAMIESLFASGQYRTALTALAALREPVDNFFDQVMVMADDEAVKNNRIALLSQVGSLCTRVADISRLQLES